MSPVVGLALGGGVGYLASSLPVAAYAVQFVPEGDQSPDAATQNAKSMLSGSLLIITACVIVGGYVGYRLTR